MKRYTLAFAALLCLLLSAQFHPVSAKDNWTRVRSKNFHLIGNASEKEIRLVATKLEQFRYVFTRLLPGVNFTSPVPTTVVVFKSDSSYKPYKPVVDGKINDVAGYFQGGRDVNYITLTTEKGRENPYSIIFHEYVHLLVNNTMGEASVPPWFNEGLAEYYSTFDIEDNQKVFLGNLISGHLRILREQNIWPLQDLFRVDHYSLSRNKAEAKSFFYAQSWALVHYLILGNNGQRLPQTGRFISLLMQNVPVEKAFREAFQADFATMEKELKEYVRKGTFPGKVATFERKLEFESEMQAAPITEAEALAYLGDLLLHTNRPEDAEARLKQSLAIEPNNAMALSSLGMVRVHQKRFAEARELLKKASEAGTQNYLAHYYYALSLSREGMTEQETVSRYPAENVNIMRAELRKAIELKPDYPESYSLLAFVQMVSGEIDDGITLMRKALELSPGNQTYAFMLAQAYMNKGDYEQAKTLLSALAQNASEPQLRASAQSMLEAIASMQARYGKNSGGPDDDKDGDGASPRLQRRNNNVQGGAPEATATGEPETATPPRPFDSSAALREALRPLLAGQTRVQGMLTHIDCTKAGVVFTIRVGERLLKFHAAAFEEMDISTYTTEVSGEISCGARRPENPVLITYRPSSGARARGDGEAIALEFVPKDFVLEKK